MLDAGTFRELVSGQRRGVGASFARCLLRAAETPYTWAIRWRNDRYDRRPSRATRLDVPVVSVGNLTLGGTGKTPMVRWLVRRFWQSGWQPAIVSRGYGAAQGEKNDEALELEQSLPGVPHVQNPDRIAGARQAIERYDADSIVLDDGFQHRRLGRDLDIVLLDAMNPFGCEHVFPRGMLREPVEGLRRAQVVCLSRADFLDESGRRAIRARVASLAPEALWCEAVHQPAELRNALGVVAPLSVLAGCRVAAFCGIGNPSALQKTLAALGADIVTWREFADHHRYTRENEAQLAADVRASAVDLVVTTHKDLVKLPQPSLGDRPLWAVTIELSFLGSEPAIADLLSRGRSASSRVFHFTS
jgi:tetraacyldisaccharide 4'-kinase